MTAATVLSPARAGHVHRVALPGAREDHLYFAQVREDARLEIEALEPSADDSIVVVSSGGCTALSLLAAGAGHVTGVDLNRSQNHLVELKLAAVATLPNADVLAFIGASLASGDARLRWYAQLRCSLTHGARAYWDARTTSVASGVLNAGVTEAFIRAVVHGLRLGVHSRGRIEHLLACTSVAEQRRMFDEEWNTWRWRALFRALLNRVVFRRAYDPAFFDNVEKPSFADHFRARADYTLTALPVADNYFLHHMLTGVYPARVPGGVPLYADPFPPAHVAHWRDALTLADGSMTDYLGTLPADSVTGFALSNICEWLKRDEVDALFTQVVRTAAPNARICFRNFVGWTEVPERWRRVVVEDRARGEALMARDRSVVQRRFAICSVRGGTTR
jgi:S-adenosylmethionine-diacylglycerol 3-amino-3-carboxypropyl transferase